MITTPPFCAIKKGPRAPTPLIPPPSNIPFPTLTLDEEPVVDDGLDVAVEEAGGVVAHLQVGDMDQRTRRGPQRLLAEDAHDQLSILHHHLPKRRCQ